MTTPLTFGSLFAGIEGFGSGLESAGMRCEFQVEIDDQCRSVLARHWPNVPRWNDVREFNGSTTVIRPDWLTGGFPCQDLSVAGRRAGLAGERSGLWHEFHRIIGEFRPRGVLIENVPGLLSSNGGRDMGIVLGGLGQLGYGWAYRVLDAQWFGVAQRRRRVFIVGHLGGVRRAAEILFERNCLPWDSPPSRAARARVAASLTAGVASGSGVNRPGRRREDDVNLALCLNGKNGKRYDGESESFVVGSLQSHSKEHGHAMTTQQAVEAGQLVAYRVHSERSCAMQGNGDANMADPCEIARNLDSNGGWSLGQGGNLVAFQERGRPEGRTLEWQEDQAYSLNAPTGGARTNENCIAFDERNLTSRENRSNPQPGDPCHTLHSDAPRLAERSAVRRLTPRECERLQGFDDDWTRYGHDGKEISDSARYRMLGNAVNRKVAAWLGQQIARAA